MTTKKRGKPELFMRLNDEEDFGAGSCGCILQRSPEPGMNACPEFLMCQQHVHALKYHKPLLLALGDLLSTEDCVCREAELKKGTCSVCTYNKLLNRAIFKRSGPSRP